MATKYPYVGVPGAVTAVIDQLRKAFPANVTADTLRKWSIAPKNESYLLNVLRFIGVIDEDGGKLPDASQVFSLHNNSEFSAEFSKLVRSSYSELFDLFGDDAWNLEVDKLIGFFRTEDESSATVGQRQAAVFRKLAALSGHGDPDKRVESGVSKPRTSTKKNASRRTNKKASGDAEGATSVSERATSVKPQVINETGVALTVRIEINLPATNEQAVYDKIFKSIKSNLIDAD